MSLGLRRIRLGAVCSANGRIVHLERIRSSENFDYQHTRLESRIFRDRQIKKFIHSNRRQVDGEGGKIGAVVLTMEMVQYGSRSDYLKTDRIISDDLKPHT